MAKAGKARVSRGPRLKPWVNSVACEKPVKKGIPAIKVLLQGFSSRERGVTFKAMVQSFLRDIESVPKILTEDLLSLDFRLGKTPKLEVFLALAIDFPDQKLRTNERKNHIKHTNPRLKPWGDATSSKSPWLFSH